MGTNFVQRKAQGKINTTVIEDNALLAIQDNAGSDSVLVQEKRLFLDASNNLLRNESINNYSVTGISSTGLKKMQMAEMTRRLLLGGSAEVTDYVMNFNGTSQYLAITNDNKFNFWSGSFSVSWIEEFPMSQSANGGGIITKGLTTSLLAGVFGITIEGSSTNTLAYYEGKGGSSNAFRLISYTPNGKHHFVFIRDLHRRKITFYMDGKLYCDRPYTDNANGTMEHLFNNSDVFFRATNDATKIYTYGNNNYLRVFNYSLNYDEVQMLWNFGSPEDFELPTYMKYAGAKTNLVANNNFSAGFSTPNFTSWNGNTGSVSGAVIGKETTAANLPYEYKDLAFASLTKYAAGVKLTLGSTSSTTYPQIYQGITLTYGKKYFIRFWAKTATAGSNIRIYIQESGAVTGKYRTCLAEVVSLTTAWKQYCYEFNIKYPTQVYSLQFLQQNGIINNTQTITGVEIYQTGCLLDMNPNSMTATDWTDLSGNGYTIIKNGTPVIGTSTRSIMLSALQADNNQMLIKQTLMSDTTFNCVPAGWKLKSMIFNNLTTTSVTLKVGTTSGGSDIVAAVAIGSQAVVDATLLKTFFSAIAYQDIYVFVNSGTWSGAMVDVTIRLERAVS